MKEDRRLSLPCHILLPSALKIYRSQKTPQISMSSSRKRCSSRGLQPTLSLDNRTVVLRCVFSTTISALEVLPVGDWTPLPPILCSTTIRSPPL